LTGTDARDVMGIPQEDSELKKFLKDLLRFMRDAAESYDSLFDAEAHRLAVCVRAIVQDTGWSQSILGRLCVQRTVYFYDNCPEYNPRIGLPFSGLAIPTIKGGSSGYMPRLGQNPGVKFRKVSFDEWWHRPVIVDSWKGIDLSREDIVISVSNTYCGASDSRLNRAYNELILKNRLDWVDESAAVPEELIGMEFAGARHIAFELIKSLEEQTPYYF